MSDLTADLLAAVVAATPERKAAALRVLRGETPTLDPETLRRCSGQAEPFLTLKECAKRLGVSGCSLWRWQVPKHDLGGRPKFRISEIETYLQSDTFRRRAAELREQDRARRGGGTGKRTTDRRLQTIDRGRTTRAHQQVAGT
jgi:predicted DNA-binding transcriptional regulator AlpA